MNSQNNLEKSMILSEKSLKIQKMFDKISFKYDFLNRLLSVGQDVRWRSHMIKKFPIKENNNGTLYDVACGTGDVLFATTNKRKDYQKLIGFDISSGMLAKANERNKSTQIQFVQASAESIPAPDNSADCVTIAFGFRNIDNRNKALKEFHRVLNQDGTLFILDFFEANNNFFAKLFDFYFKKILPFIGGVFSDKSAYEYLPNSVSTMPSSNEFKKMLTDIGFIEIEEKCWLAGSTRLFKAVKKF